MRWTFGLAAYELVKRDKRVVLIMCDVGKGLFARIAADFPAQYLNAGICEQATVSMAAGMAMGGMRPIVYTITPFLIERAFEQVKLDVNQMNQPVGLVGYSDNESGPTHCETDAGIIMGLFPNIRSYFPKRKEEVTEIVANLDLNKPWFISLKPEQV